LFFHFQIVIAFSIVDDGISLVLLVFVVLCMVVRRIAS
jgi:hypothetical protein